MIYMKTKFVCDNCNASIESEMACTIVNIPGMQQQALSPIVFPNTFTPCGDKILCKKCDDEVHQEE
jgi:hypothetical protein